MKNVFALSLNKNKIFAFTLAEVLITLAIIGVVAAMTISIIQNYQDTQFRTGAKKFLSDLSNATNQMASDNGGSLWDMPNMATQDATETNNMFSNYQKYFNFIHYEDLGCGQYTGPMFAGLYNNYKSNTKIRVNAYAYHCNFKIATLGNGQSLLFTSLPLGPGVANNNRVIWGEIIIDLNSSKGPNAFGRDLFVFEILKNTDGSFIVVPAGNPGDIQYSCTPGDTNIYGNGSVGCTYYVLNDIQMP